jgi:phosphatidylserine decarboxylase
MTVRSALLALFLQEDLNFLLTNRVPRRLLTQFMGWFSKIEQPLVRDLSIGIWRRFADLELHEARKEHFTSLHDCFTRELKPGARAIDPDPDVVVSPCDALVGACGRVDGTTLVQTKGFPYTLPDLLGDDPELIELYRDGWYVTLRLTASMYHRFHAPHDCVVERVTYFSGDTWNVNPIALRRIEKLFCKNERAALRTRLAGSGHLLTLVPVAAILVASIRLRFLDVLLDMHYRGAKIIPCHAQFKKGEEMGGFQHGSTVICFAPRGFALCGNVREGSRMRLGQPLFRLPDTTANPAA